MDSFINQFCVSTKEILNTVSGNLKQFSAIKPTIIGIFNHACAIIIYTATTEGKMAETDTHCHASMIASITLGTLLGLCLVLLAATIITGWACIYAHRIMKKKLEGENSLQKWYIKPKITTYNY